jgi:transcriptional regulator of aromatic amino acid metabolism
VLQDHEFQRLGGKETVRVDVRVIAATHNDLEAAISADKFRQDLYYRLNVVTLYVLPLRELPEDIVPLTEFLLRKHCREPLPEITPELEEGFVGPRLAGQRQGIGKRCAEVRDPKERRGHCAGPDDARHAQDVYGIRRRE